MEAIRGKDANRTTINARRGRLGQYKNQPKVGYIHNGNKGRMP